MLSDESFEEVYAGFPSALCKAFTKERKSERKKNTTPNTKNSIYDSLTPILNARKIIRQLWSRIIQRIFGISGWNTVVSGPEQRNFPYN